MPEEYRGWYDMASLVAQSQPLPDLPIASGPSPVFAGASGGSTPLARVQDLTIKLSALKFASSTATSSSNNNETYNTNSGGSSSDANTKLADLQCQFEQLAETELLPKYLIDDPNLKVGCTGSFKTSKVGNPSKPTYGQSVNLEKFDIDYWIESDILFKKYGPNLRADLKFREILSKIPGFEGLKPNKEGLSIKFKPSKQ
ncbi:hypothetical protein KW844_12865 [Chitinophaga sp. sic0106]|nr:hypothetical protein [Chitinophaga sp. sic0106]